MHVFSASKASDSSCIASCFCTNLLIQAVPIIYGRAKRTKLTKKMKSNTLWLSSFFKPSVKTALRWDCEARGYGLYTWLYTRRWNSHTVSKAWNSVPGCLTVSIFFPFLEIQYTPFPCCLWYLRIMKQLFKMLHLDTCDFLVWHYLWCPDEMLWPVHISCRPALCLKK